MKNKFLARHKKKLSVEDITRCVIVGAFLHVLDFIIHPVVNCVRAEDAFTVTARTTNDYVTDRG